MSMSDRLGALNAAREVNPNISYWQLRDIVNDDTPAYNDGKNSNKTFDNLEQAFANSRQKEYPSQNNWIQMMHSPNSDYNYEGFYNSNPDRAWDMINANSKQHFTDEFKNDNHPTYSDEAIESVMGLGPKGGHWYPDNYGFEKGATVPTFAAQDVNLNTPKYELNKFGVNDLYNYFKLEEPGYIPTYNGAALLPEVNITPKK